MKSLFLRSAAFVAVGGAAMAADIDITSDITTSTTWTKNNKYNLVGQIYVTSGATLTVEAGTVVASDPGGSLAVTRDSRILVQGTKDEPVIMTSKADVATWTGGDPKTGVYRVSANEWGNLTLMGNAYISEDANPSNTPTFNANNEGDMEGLANDGSGRNKYGGGDDDDDSGSISYLSLRYGGLVLGFNNELNGLSMGGIGRETDVHHVEIMNNVDDGIETWGGTVNYKNFSIWNVGDDSFDVDQGWRGKAQFGLIVQGYSLEAKQGSGVGDNCFETDGAEQCDYQPVTTATIYNCTVIGQPDDNGGDHGTAWRDNARVQYRNCIFMDLGEELVRFDNVDGDGGLGYGCDATGGGPTLDWAGTWTTDFDNVPGHTFDPAGSRSDWYPAQTSGKLAEIKDSVFYDNDKSNAYSTADSVNVRDPGNDNVTASVSPVTNVTRLGSPFPVPPENKIMDPVLFLDPTPANDALTSVAFADPSDGFFSSPKFRGAFKPGINWLAGWTAASAYGMTSNDTQWCDIGCEGAGTNGDPILYGEGDLVDGGPISLHIRNGRANAKAWLVIGVVPANLKFGSGALCTLPLLFLGGFQLNGSGSADFGGNWSDTGGIPLYFQFLTLDPLATKSFAPTNGLKAQQ